MTGVPIHLHQADVTEQLQGPLLDRDSCNG